jgi:uncharacterized repeat protein (TIGR01451 family)
VKKAQPYRGTGFVDSTGDLKYILSAMTHVKAVATAVLSLAVGMLAGCSQPAPAPPPGPPPAPVGSAEAGKAHFAFGNTSCSNCHGPAGEGAFGKALAGQKIPYEKFREYVRAPVAKMPAFTDANLTDQEIADMVAYFDSLPPAAKEVPWRTPVVENAPEGQQLAIAGIGCAQCHGATLTTPRHGAAEVSGDFEWFKRMVYEHTTRQPEQWALLDPAIQVTPRPSGPPGRNRIRMGNYDRDRLSEEELKLIWDWIMDLGYLPPLRGILSAGMPGGGGVTYDLKVVNAGVKDRGVTAEGVTVQLVLPAGTKVVKATGTGYEGVRADREAKANVAVWQLPKLAATDQEALTITLASEADLRGSIRWAKPVVKSDPIVNIGRAGGARGGREGGGRGGAREGGGRGAEGA